MMVDRIALTILPDLAPLSKVDCLAYREPVKPVVVLLSALC